MSKSILEEKKRRQKLAALEKTKDEVESESESESEGEFDEEEDEELLNDWKRTPEAVSKYKQAADIANRVIGKVIELIAPGKTVLELAETGDNMILKELEGKHKKAKVEKGIAFPTCISINNCLGHYSPLSSDTTTIKEGDVVKVDLGVHIDGYIAGVAHTTIATADKTKPVEGKKADVICAAWYAADAALKLMRPGKTNQEVTEAIAKIAKEYKVNPVEGVLSHEIRRYIIDGDRTIINKTTTEQKVETFTFSEGEAYTIDIVMSTGEGKSREVESRTTVYKRAPEAAYSLKLKASRYVFNEITEKAPVLPFSLRALDEKKAKLGIVELVKHDLVHPYPVLFEKPGEFVAQFKFTVMILPTNISKITGHNVLPFVKSAFSIEDAEIKSILALGTKRASEKKKAKKKKKAAAAASAGGAPELISAEKPADKPADKPAEKPAEQPAEKPAEKPAEEAKQ